MLDRNLWPRIPSHIHFPVIQIGWESAHQNTFNPQPQAAGATLNPAKACSHMRTASLIPPWSWLAAHLPQPHLPGRAAWKGVRDGCRLVSPARRLGVNSSVPTVQNWAQTHREHGANDLCPASRPQTVGIGAQKHASNHGVGMVGVPARRSTRTLADGYNEIKCRRPSKTNSDSPDAL